MKLNEFKKPVVNEIDSRSLFGDYGSAALRTGLGSLAGKNVLSTTDQMAKDDFITKFTSRALSGLQSAINGGLVDPNITGQSTQTSQQGTQTTGQTTQQGTQSNPANTADAIAQKRIAAQKAQAAAIREPGADEGPKYKISPNKQMQTKVAGSTAIIPKASTVAADTPKTPEQIRQEKLVAATKVAQDQIAKNGPSGPYSNLPANQAAVQAGNIRKQKQGIATQNAQGQMTKMSPLPADQFNKTATSTRQKQQGQATTAAQGQMSQMSPLPTDQFNKSATNVRRQKQGVATQTAQDQMSATQKTIKPDNTITMPKRNRKPKGTAAESSRFAKLNYIFESILSEQDTAQGVDSQPVQTKQTISQYITTFFKQFMKNVEIRDPAVQTQVASLAKELEQTYTKDKGRTALPKLANLAYSVSYANDPEEENNRANAAAAKKDDEARAAKAKAEAEKEQKAKINSNTIIDNVKKLSPNQQKVAFQKLQKEFNIDTKTTGTKNTSTALINMMKNLSPNQQKIVYRTLQKEFNVEPAKTQKATSVEKEPIISVGKQKRSAKTVDPADAQLYAAAKKQGKI